MTSETGSTYLGNQPWANAPASLTDTGAAYQPDPETQARLDQAIEDYALGSYTPPEQAE
jgi:hypothetical protein